MTSQTPESLIYQGEKMSLMTLPLEQYFHLAGVERQFEPQMTWCVRGYYGTWEIVGDRLYLIGIRGVMADGSDASLGKVFPDFPDRVFAHWYTGELRLPQGERLKYVHSGFSSSYERDLFIEIDRGMVISTRVRVNEAESPSSAPASDQAIEADDRSGPAETQKGGI